MCKDLAVVGSDPIGFHWRRDNLGQGRLIVPQFLPRKGLSRNLGPSRPRPASPTWAALAEWFFWQQQRYTQGDRSPSLEVPKA